jgi:hypothetical protein
MSALVAPEGDWVSIEPQCNIGTIPSPCGRDYYRAEVDHEAIAHRLLDAGDEEAASYHFNHSYGCNRMWTWTASGTIVLTR